MRTLRRVLPVAFFAMCFPAAQAQYDWSAAEAGLAEFASVCKESAERLWGASLCGRLMLVEPQSRMALTAIQDPNRKFERRGAFFFGPLPPDLLIANTSLRWDGEEWAMVLLPLPTDQFLRLRLLAHESFHRLQPALKLRASDAAAGHLDSDSGRLWLRLELRALARALRTADSEARASARDALLFRLARQRLNPGSEPVESSLEIQEGLAEYTGTVMALEKSGEVVSRVARAVEDFEDRPAFARSFAYATGPALGLLLDQFGGPTWRRKVGVTAPLASLLAAALNVQPSADVVRQAEARGQDYGFRAVSQDERARATRTQAMLARFRALFVEGPVLEFPKTEELRRSFNPGNLVPLGENGTVYPTGTFVSRWGKLQVDDVGALLSADNQSLRVVAPADPQLRPVKGSGWQLELAPGWTLRPAAKPGSFILSPE